MFFKFIALIAAFLLTFPGLSDAQVPFPSHCPAVKVVEDFRLDDYMGVWYEYAKYPFVFEIGKKCMFARYRNIGDNTISVMNAAINRLTDERSNVTGKAKVVSSGALAVVFPRSSKQNFDKANYLVLGTDYNSYAVVYSCSNFTPVAHTKIVWILTRERKPSEATVAAAKKVMSDNDLTQAFLMQTLQDDCPDIPKDSPAENETATTENPTTKDEDTLLITTNNIIEAA